MSQLQQSEKGLGKLPQQLPRLAAEVCRLSQEAGKRIMQFYGDGTAVTWKDDGSPLTAADRASHDFLVNPLKSLIPEAAVVSEESDDLTKLRDSTGLFWHRRVCRRRRLLARWQKTPIWQDWT